MWFTVLAIIVMFLLGVAAGAFGLWEAQRRDIWGLRQRNADPVTTVINALVDGRLDLAEALLAKMVRVDRDNITLNRALAAVYRRQGRYQKALNRDRTIAVREKIRPNVKAEAFYHLSLDYLGLGNSRRAVEALEEAMRLAPRNRRIARTLVDLLAERGDWERAYEILSRRSTPGDPKAAARLAHFQVEMGQAVMNDGRPKAARRHFARAIEFHPEGYAARLLLGDSFMASEQYERAVEAWEQIVKNRPPLFSALYPRFRDAFFNDGRFDELGAYLRRHLSEHNDDPRGIVILAQYLAKKQRFDDAIRELRAALQVDPGYIEAHRELGLLLVKQGHSADALDAYKELLAQLPGRTPAFHCNSCKSAHIDLFWRCPVCGAFESAVPVVTEATPPDDETTGRMMDRVRQLLPDPVPVRKVRPV